MQPFDFQSYLYPSQRRVVFARNGMVATSQSLAAQAGLEILRQGGNAIDAAIATAACLTVVEPTSSGIGGDAFALIWNQNKLHGLNSSGPAPKSISSELLRKEGYQNIPAFGLIPVTVPGVPAAWAELSRKFGKLPFSKVLTPAIAYADNGFPVSSLVSYLWKNSYQQYLPYIKDEVFHYWFEAFAPENRTPEPGELWRLPAQAETLQKIADSNAESFYRGEIAEKIDTFFSKYDGYLSKEDLASFIPQWVNPISISYRGYDIWEIPPNGQGLVALMALNILRKFHFTNRDKSDIFHHQIEAMKLAFIDGQHYITDFSEMQIRIEDFLSSEYAH
jgi:gamma-glutamyltranspeptidase/glutathione hydrolase